MELFSYLPFLFELYLIFTVVILLLDNRDPAATFAWIFIFILLPVIGFIIYLFVGRNWKKSYDRNRKLPQFVAKNLLTIFKPLIDVQDETINQFKKSSTVYQDDLMTLLYRNSNALLTMHNKIEVFHDGQTKFDRLLADISAAKKFIHLEYFIWYSNDAISIRMKEALLKKAKEGVEIKVLYDYSGCLFTLTQKYIRELRKAGIKIYPFFNYLSGFKMHTLNYRNHRKIVVIDGEIGYTGGMNVGQEYIDGGKKFESWRDTHLKVEGESVKVLQAVFAIDWYNTVSDETIFDEKYFPQGVKEADVKNVLPMQLTTSGYDTTWPSILHLYFALITLAQKNIYIVSPYFIPDPSLLMALKTAAMRGINVVVLMAGKPDNPVPFWAAFSYFEELLKAGVKIYQYQKGFLHAKIFSTDSRICSIGTANFDIRSLQLNYEINAVIYDQAQTKEIDAQLLKDLESSKEITLADFNQASFFVKLRSSVVRLFSPLM